MKAGVSTSVIAHAILLIVAIIGLGSAKSLEPPQVESIAVDIVPIDTIAQDRAGVEDSTIVETETPAVAETETPAELAQPTGNTEDNQITKAETDTATPAPVVNTAPEPIPEPEPAPVVEPEPEPEPTPPPPEPVTEPEPVPEPVVAEPEPELAAPAVTEEPAMVAPVPAMRTAALDKARADFKKKLEDEKKKKLEDEKRKAEEKKKAEEAKRLEEEKANAREADAIGDILNQEDSRGATTGQGGQQTLGSTDGTSASLSNTEMGMLQAHIRSCINVPLGAAEEGASVVVTFRLGPDYSVIGTPATSQVTGPTTGQMYASAAARAVRNCATKNGGYSFLPAEKYAGANGWNEVEVTFRANE